MDENAYKDLNELRAYRRAFENDMRAYSALAKRKLNEAKAELAEETQERVSKALILNPQYARYPFIRYDTNFKRIRRLCLLVLGLATVFQIAAAMDGSWLIVFTLIVIQINAGTGAYIAHRLSKADIAIEADKLGSGTSSIISTLEWCQENYDKNLELVPKERRFEVEIDRKMLDNRCWELACDARQIHKILSRGRGTLTQGNSPVQNALAKVRTDADTLQQAVTHLNDLTAIKSAQAIDDHYIDPTSADILKQIAFSRLEGQLALLPGEPEKEAEPDPKD